MHVKILMVFFTVMIAMIITGCSPQQTSFSKQVKPILDAKCLKCHDGVGEGSKKTDFITTSYASVMKGTSSGPVVAPGSAISSTLFRVVNHLTSTKIQMPPHHDTSLAEGRGQALDKKEIEIIEKWINEGAQDN